MSETRYHSLDSLRGIASFQVLIAHSLVAVPSLTCLVYPNDIKSQSTALFYLSHTPLAFFWSDSSAVKVFFVLSGFVLSLPYYNDAKQQPLYLQFFIKRIIRLTLPCFAVILLSILCKSLLFKPNDVTSFGDWVRIMWTLPVSNSVLVNLFLLRNDLDYFDRALWTLPPEIKLSLILPFVIHFLRPLRIFYTILILFMYVLIWHLLNKAGARNIWPDYSVLYYFTFFIIGSIICKYQENIFIWINSISNLQYIGLVVIMLVLYTFKYVMFWLPNRLFTFLISVNDYISAIAAILILCIVLSKRAKRLLNSSTFLFLGQISFSLYLLHIVVIASLAHLLRFYLSPGFITFIGMTITFPLAVLFYKYIEIPSLSLANRISKKLIKLNFS